MNQTTVTTAFLMVGLEVAFRLVGGPCEQVYFLAWLQGPKQGCQDLVSLWPGLLCHGATHICPLLP